MQKLSGLVTCWVVPLFILFNIVGWLGLPQREADRSRAPLPRQTYEETADLGTAIGRAWLAGILLGLIVVGFAVFKPEWLVAKRIDRKRRH